MEQNDNGSRDKPVVITSYGTQYATIDGQRQEALIVKSTYFEISRIRAQGLGRKSGNTTNGVFVDRGGFGTINQVLVAGFQKAGLMVMNSHDIVISNVVATDNGYAGICVSGDMYRNGVPLLNGKRNSKQIVVRNCRADNNPGDPSNLDNHSGSGIYIEATDTALVEYCSATNNGWDMPRLGNGPIGIWTSSSDHVTIQHCISYKNKTSTGGLDGGGFDFDGGVTNSVIQYCLSYDNQGAGYGIYQWDGASSWYNNTIRYSISLNDSKSDVYGSMAVLNSSTDGAHFKGLRVYNNLFYNEKQAIIKFLGLDDHQDFSFYNNIFIGSGAIINTVTGEDRFLNNIYWHAPGRSVSFMGYVSFEAWANATGQEKQNGVLKGKYMDPLLNGPFTTTITDPSLLNTLHGMKLQDGSHLLNRGLDLSQFSIFIPNYDFYGTKLYKGAAPEPGIHEIDE